MGPNSSQKRPVAGGSLDSAGSSSEVLDRKRLQELVKEVDPNEQLDEDVETMLLQIADDFIEQVFFLSLALYFFLSSLHHLVLGSNITTVSTYSVRRELVLREVLLAGSICSFEVVGNLFTQTKIPTAFFEEIIVAH